MSTSTTADLIEQYITAKTISGKSPDTIRGYRHRLYPFREWLQDKPLERRTIRAYIAYLQHRGLAPITVVGHVREISAFCSWLVEEGELESHPAARLAPKLPKRKPAHYKTAQARELLKVCTVRERAIVLALLDTGLRAQEFVSLRRDKLDLLDGSFTVIGKGDKERAGCFNAQALAAINTYLATRTDDDPALWYGERGPLTKSGVYQLIKRLVKRAGIRADVRRLLHSFRATYAKNFLKQRGDAKTLAETMGHTTIEMSLYYGQLNDDEEVLERKREINPLGAIIDPDSKA